MKISNHRLEGVNYKESPNTSGQFVPGNLDTIIIHYTAGSSALSSINTLVNPNAKASAHIVVGRDGEITQLLPFNKIAWHAGKSAYGDRKYFNRYSIGIEIDNAGPLTLEQGVYKSWFDRAYPENEIVKARHKNGGKYLYWHSFTKEQTKAVKELCVALRDEYKINAILGHDDIAPKRKSDPGPAFPMIELLDHVFPVQIDETVRGEDRSEGEEQKEVVASSLNFRSGPAASYDKLSEPLKKGTKVIVIEEDDSWSKIKVNMEVEGWVASNYIK